MFPARTRVLWSIVGAALIAYLAAWGFRHELGLIHPMANMRYFYYGAGHGTASDEILYAAFYPLYRVSLMRQDLGGDRYEIHARDRAPIQ